MANDPLMGRNASVKIGTVLIDNLGKWTINFTGADIDVSKFGTVWERKMPGMVGWNASLEGMWDKDDHTGQQTLLEAKIHGTKITTIRFYVDDTTYWAPDVAEDATAGCYIQNVTVSQDKAGVAGLTMSILGFGPICQQPNES